VGLYLRICFLPAFGVVVTFVIVVLLLFTGWQGCAEEVQAVNCGLPIVAMPCTTYML